MIPRNGIRGYATSSVPIYRYMSWLACRQKKQCSNRGSTSAKSATRVWTASDTSSMVNLSPWLHAIIRVKICVRGESKATVTNVGIEYLEFPGYIIQVSWYGFKVRMV